MFWQIKQFLPQIVLLDLAVLTIELKALGHHQMFDAFCLDDGTAFAQLELGRAERRLHDDRHGFSNESHDGFLLMAPLKEECQLLRSSKSEVDRMHSRLYCILTIFSHKFEHNLFTRLHVDVTQVLLEQQLLVIVALPEGQCPTIAPNHTLFEQASA